MVDIKAASALEDNLDNPFAPLLYGISTPALPDRFARSWRRRAGHRLGSELAFSMLADAGFVDVEVHDTPGDPMNCLYVARKP